MNVFVRGVLCALAVLCASLGISGAASAAVSPDEIWREVDERAIPRGPREREIVPLRYRAFALDRGRLTALLAAAPNERARRPHESPLELSLPTADGTYATFRIVESPVMEPALQAKYPALRTYLGQGLDDPTATVRFDVTHKGFHAQVIGAGGTLYIDPFQPGDASHYIAYRKHEHTAGERFVCSVTGEPIVSDAKAMLSAKVSGASLRTYRLAMAATGEYTQFHGGTVLDGLAAIVTTMNRVNGLYEREVAVRMVLVANNDLIVYTNAATDPYANTSGDLNANQSNIDAVIGSANYDIGHLVGTGGGGIAQLRSPCSASKARGLTGSGAPVGDGFDVDYVAHEMGHQFGGNHTFNGSGVNCASTNRNATTAYEPGSGVTIQAYAGICGNDDLQPNSEDYFHRVSLDEILAFTTNASTGASCGTAAATGNQPPTVTAPPSATIPGRTPFTLTAIGSDPDGDPLTYVWEQFDLGAANSEGVLDATTPAGPIFRGFTPTTSASRTFPSLRYILANANAVPARAALPGTTAPPDWMTGEVLPNATRTLNFWVTARDNRAGGGGTNEASTQVIVSNLAGPFAVTAPNTAVSLAAGAATNVTWSVANTTLPPVSTANVRITLSTDGGYTFPTELAASTANDGSESVTLPGGITTTQARVRVEAVGNIYFDISDANFSITSANAAPTIAVTGGVTTRQGSPAASGVVATIADAEDAAGALAVAVTGAPPELAVTAQNTGGNVSLSATAACELVAPTAGNKVYPVLLRVTDSAGAVTTAEVNVNVGRNLPPTLGTYANLFTTQNIVRTHAPGTPGADANANLAGASVSPTTLPGGGTVAIAPDGTLTVTTTPSTTNGTTTVLAEIADTCGAIERRNVSIQVAAPVVTLAVASTAVLTGNALVEPNECNQVAVTVRNDGNVPATGVSGVLSTSTANTSVTQATSGYPDIPPGESRTNTVPFELSSTAALACFTNVGLGLNVTYGQAGSPFVGTTNVPVGRAQGTNYVFTQTSTSATLPNDGTLVPGSNGDDTANNGSAQDPVVTVTAPFAFSIYGTNVAAGTNLRASTNGNLQLRPTSGAIDFANAALPVAGTGNGQAVFPPAAPTLFVLWDDWRMDTLEPAAAPDAGIYSKVEGVAPNRRWILEWRGRIRGDGAVSTNNNRVAIVLHEGSNSFDYIYLLTGAGASANGAGSTIGVQSAATGTTFTQYAFNNANLTPGLQLTAAIPPAICSPGSGTCGTVTPPGVTVTQSGGNTAVTEGGATDTYTIVLNAPPTGDVTIAVSPNAQLTTSGNLTFTTGNWNVAQTVTVTAVNDAIAEGAHSGAITHTATGGGYDGVVVAGVTASITDNDTAGVVVTQSGGNTSVAEGGATDTYTLVLTSQPTADVTITVSPDAQVTTSGNVTFTAADWNVAKTVTVTAVDDAVAEGAHNGTITHAAAGGGYAGVPVANVVASIADNDTRGVTIVQSGGNTSVAEGGATDTYTMQLTSQPTGTVTITVSPDAQLTVAPPSLVFDASNWNVAQTVTVTAVDDAVDEGPHAGNITHAAAGADYAGVAVAGITAAIADNGDGGLPIVDLAVSTQLLNPPLLAGKRMQYEVAVENLTAAVNVASAQFTFELSPVFTNVSWVCVAEAGASCPASGSGAPDHAISLNGGTGVSYVISADIPAGTAEGAVIATLATIANNAPHVEPFSGNNTSATSDTVGTVLIFRDGFEDPVAAAREAIGRRD